MKKIITTGLFSLLFSFQALSFDIVLMGGGGEPEGDRTIFDSGLEQFASAKTRINAKVQMSFNGGHSRTTSIINDKINVPHTSFTKENYRKLIESSLAKITSGDIPRGGQLMIIINTHGGAKEPPHETHSIALSGAKLEDLNRVSGEDSESMDKLKALASAAEIHGVKLAIVDLSCHSGNTLSLANKNTCVVSSSGPNHFAFAGPDTFSETLFKQMIPGTSLEDAYLKARADSYDRGFPMISSPIGKKLNETLYPLFTPYLYDNDPRSNKFNPYIREVARCEARGQRDLYFDILMSEVEELEKIAGLARSNYQGEEVLKDELLAYKKLQDEMLDELERLNYPLLYKKEIITYPLATKKNGNGSDELTIEKILTFPDENLTYFKDLLKEQTKNKSPKDEIADTMDSINKISAVLKRKGELNKLHPELGHIEKVFLKAEQKAAEIERKTRLISDLARRVYDKKYKDEQKLKSGPNPCADFKF